MIPITRRIDLAWGLLATLTLLGAAAILSGLRPALVLDAVLLALAVAKGRIVCLDFLGLRAAPAAWRAGLIAWVAGLAGFALLAAAVGPILAP